jgi:hypothetical protein
MFSSAPRTEDRPPDVSAPRTERTRKVRKTVDLAPARHHALKTWLDETAIELGRATVTSQDVLDALVGRLLTDETLARKIRVDLADGA